MTGQSALKHRLEFLNLDGRASSASSSKAETVRSALPTALDALCAKVRSELGLGRVFGDERRMSGAKTAQGEHRKRIVSAELAD